MEQEIKTFTDAVGATEPKVEHKNIFNRENYFRFKGTLLIVKISRSETPFFGVDKRIIDIANTKLIDSEGNKINQYYLVLLTSEQAGWVYSKSEINSKIKNGYWTYRETDKNYKINFSSIKFDSANLFSSYKQFIDRVNLYTSG